MSLFHQALALDHTAFASVLATAPRLLIIQDLDGVCMELVKDPRDRIISSKYLKATLAFENQFYVLTNGEHVGSCGLQRIVDAALESQRNQQNELVEAPLAAKKGLYLPGLAAGGVQWQDRYGQVSHPGVGASELSFLASVPQRMAEVLTVFLDRHCAAILPASTRRGLVKAAVLDNLVSPTANLNALHTKIGHNVALFAQLQADMVALMQRLLQDAEAQGLAKQFFVHYAPNLGPSQTGGEQVWFADNHTAGSTDFQFMLKGAVKEAGVLALLNHYFFVHTGRYPLGANFNARQAPSSLSELLQLVVDHFDPAYMPIIIGVGDTITSKGIESSGRLAFQRGGSDRNFLQLIQNIGETIGTPTLRAYVDSSRGELSNRQSIQIALDPQGQPQVVGGIGDPRDIEDPLKLNVVFPEGHKQYCNTFQAAASRRQQAFR